MLPEPLELHLCHADVLNDTRVRALRLVCDQKLPNFATYGLNQVAFFYTAQAETLADGLCAALPQATLERLLAALLARMSGIYRGSVPEIGT